MFTRKHFEAIAAIVREIESEKVRKQLFERFSAEFKKSNPKFNTELFKKASGIS